MTKRDLLVAISNRCEISDEMVEMAKAELVKLDSSNEKKKELDSKKRKLANAPKLAVIERCMYHHNKPLLTTEIARLCDPYNDAGDRVSSSMIGSLAKEQVDVLNRWVRGTQSVKGKGKQTTFALADWARAEIEQSMGDAE